MELLKELQKWEKEYKKGFSKPFVLLMLAESPHYPYQIIREISEKTHGKFAIAGSNIYPILKTLEDEGFINHQKDEKDQKKHYSLTNEGKDFLGLLGENMGDFVEIIQDMIRLTGDVKKNE
ncbi:MAG: PadR family transcriptional regulator [Candidatus Hodarchaeales archaeon]|jgi:PadR family transcriptional regulator PadR